MKITKISTVICDAGWRPWTYSKIETDEGITGWGEFNGGSSPRAIVGCLKDLEPLLIGRDPRAIEQIIADLNWAVRDHPGGIAQKAVGAMRAHFGSDPADIQAVMGPSIQACCYEVGQEVIEKFRSQFTYAEDLFKTLDEENPADIYLPRQVMLDGKSFLRELAPAKANLDLVEANRRQLLEAGLKARNIISGAPCTACHTDLLYSYRREGAAAGRMYAAIALIIEPYEMSSLPATDRQAPLPRSKRLHLRTVLRPRA